MPIAAPLPPNETDRIHALEGLGILDTEAEEAFERITDLVSTMFGAPIVLISLIDRERQWFKSRCGLAASETHRDLAFCAHAILSEEVFYVEDAQQDARFHDSPLVVGEPNIRTYAGAPLILSEDIRLGTLCVIYPWVNPLSAQQRADLQRFADIVVDALRHRSNAALHERACQRAEQESTEKSDFLATMSHEIRTPLNGIIGMAQALSRTALSDKQAQMLDVISLSGNTLLRLINDLLDLSRIEAGKVELELMPFSTREILTRTLELFRPTAQEKGLRYTIDFKKCTGGHHISDPTRLSQIISNLVGNAIKFTDRGEVRVEMSLKSIASSSHDVLHVAVHDTGIGINKDKINQLFQRFVQEDRTTTRRFGGSGLGLSISANLTELLGGTLMVESEKGKGSCFSLSVPLLRAGADDRPVGEVDDSSGWTKPLGAATSLRLLIAEDNPTNRLVLATMLEPLGTELTFATNGLEALECYACGRFDAVLMDIEMPEMDGLTTLGQMQKTARASQTALVPVIALTANALHDQLLRYRKAGFDDVVTKPIDMARLYQSLERIAENVLTAQDNNTAAG
jgi:two-component system, sensor histidine kinase